MDKATRTTLSAAVRLQDAASALEEAIGDLNATQAKHDVTVKRILDMVKPRLDAQDAGGKAALSALGGRQSVQQRGLEKQKDGLARIRTRFEQKNAAFSDVIDRYLDRLVRLDSSSRERERMETAAYRIIERMIYDAWPGRQRIEQGEFFRQPEGSHSYIALDIPRFLKLLIQLDAALSLDPDYAAAAGRYRPVSFLEVGCGQGRNIVIARNSKLLLAEKFSGFDINPVMVEGGQTELGLADTLFVADALEFDYGDYDVVFSYRPMSDPELQLKLEQKMARTMRPGAYLMAPYAYDLDLHSELSRIDPEIEIWKKDG